MTRAAAAGLVLSLALHGVGAVLLARLVAPEPPGPPEPVEARLEMRAAPVPASQARSGTPEGRTAGEARPEAETVDTAAVPRSRAGAVETADLASPAEAVSGRGGRAAPVPDAAGRLADLRPEPARAAATPAGGAARAARRMAPEPGKLRPADAPATGAPALGAEGAEPLAPSGAEGAALAPHTAEARAVDAARPAGATLSAKAAGGAALPARPASTETAEPRRPRASRVPARAPRGDAATPARLPAPAARLRASADGPPATPVAAGRSKGHRAKEAEAGGRAVAALAQGTAQGAAVAPSGTAGTAIAAVPDTDGPALAAGEADGRALVPAGLVGAPRLSAKERNAARLAAADPAAGSTHAPPAAAGRLARAVPETESRPDARLSPRAPVAGPAATRSPSPADPAAARPATGERLARATPTARRTDPAPAGGRRAAARSGTVQSRPAPPLAAARLASAAGAADAGALATRATAGLAWAGGAQARLDPRTLATVQSFMGAVRARESGMHEGGVRDAISAMLAGVACSRLQAAFVPETGALEIRGHVPEPALRGEVEARLRRMIGESMAVGNDLLHLPAPQCEVLGTVAGLGLPQSADQANDPLVVGEAAQARIVRFAAGERLALTLQAPDYPAHVYLDYYDSEGNVIHLIPNEHAPLARHPPDATIRVGGADGLLSGLDLTIAAPFGRDIVVSIATSEPLHDGLRPMIEPAGPYLDWLRARLATWRTREGAKGEWVYLFIDTAPR